jgi:hypothetical protein
MQNKPNFPKPGMFLNLYSKNDYENENASSLRQNKPNQTQFQTPQSLTHTTPLKNTFPSAAAVLTLVSADGPARSPINGTCSSAGCGGDSNLFNRPSSPQLRFFEEPIDPWSRQPEPRFPLDQRANRNYNFS